MARQRLCGKRTESGKPCKHPSLKGDCGRHGTASAQTSTPPPDLPALPDLAPPSGVAGGGQADDLLGHWLVAIAVTERSGGIISRQLQAESPGGLAYSALAALRRGDPLPRDAAESLRARRCNGGTRGMNGTRPRRTPGRGRRRRMPTGVPPTSWPIGSAASSGCWRAWEAPCRRAPPRRRRR